ncbi:YbjN domain-containing protein [Brasilonema bromeliae]|uniref:YbjN domain-containing protein n=1 Tax=Brasilonema bromeliae SPC951 TaxID=385972 RepID=A0ABX1PEQ4_9CYAN|nr:YbjN domain-containing protein [Brasilonema bromeliae]NMG22433.1 YbjN domain-containing protein [Brasilonema bromeliae SPC951]
MTSYQSNQETVATESTSTDELINEIIEEANAINYVEIIENVIDTLEQDDSAMVSHPSEGSYRWKFKYGTVEVFVQLTGTTDEDTLTVWSAVLKLPAKDEPRLMRELLEMNASTTFEARFAIIENQVVVLTTRTLADLSPGEASRLITIVATIADNNDEALESEFGVS